MRKRPGSEAGCPIFVIIQRTRYAQTAFHVDFLVSLRDTRIEEDSENSTSSKDLLVRNVFDFWLRIGYRLAIMARPAGAKALRAIPKL